MTAQNPYKVLGIPQKAGQEEVQAAWAKALKLARKEGPQAMEEVNNARSILIDPEKRASLDLKLFPEADCPDVEVELPTIPEEPTLQWMENAFRWKWDTGEEALGTYRPDVKLPSEESLWQGYVKPPVHFDNEPIISWLDKYAEKDKDPWRD